MNHPAGNGLETAWNVAGDPDLDPFTATSQQPVDFAVWQAARPGAGPSAREP